MVFFVGEDSMLELGRLEVLTANVGTASEVKE